MVLLSGGGPKPGYPDPGYPRWGCATAHGEMHRCIDASMHRCTDGMCIRRMHIPSRLDTGSGGTPDPGIPILGQYRSGNTMIQITVLRDCRSGAGQSQHGLGLANGIVVLALQPVIQAGGLILQAWATRCTTVQVADTDVMLLRYGVWLLCG